MKAWQERRKKSSSILTSPRTIRPSLACTSSCFSPSFSASPAVCFGSRIQALSQRRTVNRCSPICTAVPPLKTRLETLRVNFSKPIKNPLTRRTKPAPSSKISPTASRGRARNGPWSPNVAKTSMFRVFRKQRPVARPCCSRCGSTAPLKPLEITTTPSPSVPRPATFWNSTTPRPTKAVAVLRWSPFRLMTGTN